MARLADQLAALATMSPAQLRERWGEVCSTPTPRLSPDLLRLAIAWSLQEQKHGGISSRVLRQLTAGPDTPAPAAPSPALSPGAQLVRTWRGRTISVMVIDGGFSFDGRTYGSLSEIAREVTGAHWSGPRFFGLTTTKATAHG